MDMRVGLDILEPVGFLASSRGEIDFAIHFLELERGYARQPGFSSGGGQQEYHSPRAKAAFVIRRHPGVEWLHEMVYRFFGHCRSSRY